MTNRRNRSRVLGVYEGTLEMGSRFWPVTTRDISLNGARVVLDMVLPLNARCRLHIPLNDEIDVAVEAVVARITGQEVALHFMEMDEESYFHLANIVRLRSENPDIIDAEELTPK